MFRIFPVPKYQRLVNDVYDYPLDGSKLSTLIHNLVFKPERTGSTLKIIQKAAKTEMQSKSSLTVTLSILDGILDRLKGKSSSFEVSIMQLFRTLYLQLCKRKKSLELCEKAGEFVERFFLTVGLKSVHGQIIGMRLLEEILDNMEVAAPARVQFSDPAGLSSTFTLTRKDEYEDSDDESSGLSDYACKHVDSRVHLDFINALMANRDILSSISKRYLDKLLRCVIVYDANVDVRRLILSRAFELMPYVRVPYIAYCSLRIGASVDPKQIWPETGTDFDVLRILIEKVPVDSRSVLLSAVFFNLYDMKVNGEISFSEGNANRGRDNLLQWAETLITACPGAVDISDMQLLALLKFLTCMFNSGAELSTRGPSLETYEFIRSFFSHNEHALDCFQHLVKKIFRNEIQSSGKMTRNEYSADMKAAILNEIKVYFIENKVKAVEMNFVYMLVQLSAYPEYSTNSYLIIRSIIGYGCEFDDDHWVGLHCLLRSRYYKAPSEVIARILLLMLELDSGLLADTESLTNAILHQERENMEYQEYNAARDAEIYFDCFKSSKSYLDNTIKSNFNLEEISNRRKSTLRTLDN